MISGYVQNLSSICGCMVEIWEKLAYGNSSRRCDINLKGIRERDAELPASIISAGFTKFPKLDSTNHWNSCAGPCHFPSSGSLYLQYYGDVEQ